MKTILKGSSSRSDARLETDTPAVSQVRATQSNTESLRRKLAERLGDGFAATCETVQNVFPEVKLVTHHVLPKWSKDNSFIVNWHRYPKADYSYCFKSILKWHSETGNIWTHLLAAVMCLAFIVRLFTRSPNFVAPVEEKAMISLFLISGFLCMTFSALYHTLSAHSERVLRLFGRLDFSGISLLVMGSFVPWVYYSFYCSTQSRVVYLITISLLGIGAIVFSQWDRFAKPEYRVVRAAMFASLGASGLIPMLHSWIALGTRAAFTEGQLQWMLLMFLSYGVGALLYATRIPEKFFPGKVDLLFHSHQIFHVFVVVGILCHFHCILNLQSHRSSMGNKCN